MKNTTVGYKSSVKTPAGWRSVYMTAEAEIISPKRAKIVKVSHIDGEEVGPFMSRTGANRQKFNGCYFAENEEGKIKNLSACKVLEENINND